VGLSTDIEPPRRQEEQKAFQTTESMFFDRRDRRVCFLFSEFVSESIFLAAWRLGG
jgi:hypothetical protein